MKVIIDAFDTEEQAVAFVDWLTRQMDMGIPKLICVSGEFKVDFDGMDVHQHDGTKLVMNIVVDEIDGEESWEDC